MRNKNKEGSNIMEKNLNLDELLVSLQLDIRQHIELKKYSIECIAIKQTRTILIKVHKNDKTLISMNYSNLDTQYNKDKSLAEMSDDIASSISMMVKSKERKIKIKNTTIKCLRVILRGIVIYLIAKLWEFTIYGVV